MFETTIDWWEPIVRVSILWLFLLVLLRVSGKREIGQLGPMELLTMLLISETVSPALTAGDESVPTAMIASTTLVVLAVALAVATYLSKTVERAAEGTARPLVREGQVEQRAQRAERITDQELATALRKAQLRGLEDVEAAFVEPDGQITFIPKR
jgi:uncharacterized membrane protein YcaP (DUF421 family)